MRNELLYVLPGIASKASHIEETGEDYQEATPELQGDEISDLGGMDYNDFKELQKQTLEHWKEQQTENKAKLEK